LLLIDGAHDEQAVRRDWNDWSKLFGPVAWLFFMMHVFSGAAGRSQRTAQSVSWTVCPKLPTARLAYYPGSGFRRHR